MKLKTLVLSSLVLLSACSQDQEADLYKVTSKDSEGYYHASKLVKAEDNTLVPESFYGIKEEVVFLPENVQGITPEVGNKVLIDLDKNGENPLVQNH